MPLAGVTLFILVWLLFLPRHTVSSACSAHPYALPTHWLFLVLLLFPEKKWGGGDGSVTIFPSKASTIFKGTAMYIVPSLLKVVESVPGFLYYFPQVLFYSSLTYPSE